MATALSTALPMTLQLQYALGPELVTGGGFSSATGWTLGTGWAISSGVATITPPGSTSFLTWAVTPDVGALYRVEFTVTSFTAGITAPRFMNAGTPVSASIINVSGPGTYVAYTTLSATADGFAMLGNSTASLSIDNVSLRKVL